MNIICFGDSNTYGYDSRSWFGGRYDTDSRWVGILAVETGWTVSNMGQNGREIPATDPAFLEDTDLLIVMLGTTTCSKAKVRSRPPVSWSDFSLGSLCLGTNSC